MLLNKEFANGIYLKTVRVLKIRLCAVSGVNRNRKGLKILYIALYFLNMSKDSLKLLFEVIYWDKIPENFRHYRIR